LLLYHEDNPCESINRIPPGVLVDGIPASEVWPSIYDVAIGHADAIVAHNADFDRGFVPASLRDVVPWICTKNDVTWPKQTKPGMSLVQLALAHDLGVAVAHRALADCDLIARLLTRCSELGHDIDAMLVRGLRPKVTLRALVSFDDRQKANEQGFHWNPTRKEWLRRMVEEDATGFDFPVRVVADE
jgi:DNA polymerase-3 subunit epsilon